MDFILEQLYKLKDTVICLNLYEDISYMDLALKNKTIEKLEEIIEAIIKHSVNLALDYEEEEKPLPFSKLYILDISKDIIDVTYWLIKSLEENDNFMRKEYCDFILELTKELKK